jgi:hypothetical protein
MIPKHRRFQALKVLYVKDSELSAATGKPNRYTGPLTERKK